MREPLLELRGATVAFGDRVILRDRSFRVEAGERVALAGPNGSGKTTLLRVLSGELRAGELSVASRAIGQWNVADLARRRALLEQQPACAWDLTVAELVALGGHGGEEILERLGILQLANSAVTRLSGGERRMAHLARCLAQLGEPAGKVLLLDEPDAGLDAARLALAETAIGRFAREGGAVVLATHGRMAEGMRVERI